MGALTQQPSKMQLFEQIEQLKAENEKLREGKAEDVSFHYATIESEMKEALITEISDMIYNAIPVGEVTAWDCIKIFKELKTKIESL